MKLNTDHTAPKLHDPNPIFRGICSLLSSWQRAPTVHCREHTTTGLFHSCLFFFSGLFIFSFLVSPF
ncbi:hypothetical protein DL95DRAFT_143804 [Leptodontidium sp. 2 PMI_412]|nr:hypothetical protein DL95DRAFT_143804 [Leptodontidium sp. 2 PMI_412]